MKKIFGIPAVMFSMILIMVFCMGISARADDFPIQGIYEISSALDEGFVLDAKHCTQQEVTYETLQLYRPLQVKQQEFYLEFTSAHSCRIVSLQSGKYLTQTDVSGVNGKEIIPEASGQVRLRDAAFPVGRGETDPQFWHLVSRKDGTFLICSDSGLYLTIPSRRTYNGAELSLQPFNGSKNQKWMFKKASVYAGEIADTDVVNPYQEDGRLHNLTITVKLRDHTETLSADTLASWMVSQDEHTLQLDEEKLKSFVTYLAEHYNTTEHAREFMTHYKVPIVLSHGNFGWKLDEENMLNQLRDVIQTPGRKVITASWVQKGGDKYSINTDIGDSYVEIDLNAQKVWLYKDGKELLETDCVSGTLGTDRETPGGVYYVYYKQAPAVLNGPGYSEPVSYWMPFNGNIGMHDAPWRSTFGGDIYKTDGSHGCINLPLEAAKTIYETVSIGFPVVCYH